MVEFNNIRNVNGSSNLRYRRGRFHTGAREEISQVHRMGFQLITDANRQSEAERNTTEGQKDRYDIPDGIYSIYSAE